MVESVRNKRFDKNGKWDFYDVMSPSSSSSSISSTISEASLALVEEFYEGVGSQDSPHQGKGFWAHNFDHLKPCHEINNM